MFRMVYTEKHWDPSLNLRPSFISASLLYGFLGAVEMFFSRALRPLSVVLTPRVMAQAGGSSADCSLRLLDFRVGIFMVVLHCLEPGRGEFLRSGRADQSPRLSSALVVTLGTGLGNNP